MNYWMIPGIHSLYRSEYSPAITEESIINMVCQFYGMKPIDLKTKDRGKKVVLPRQVAMYLVLKVTGNTLTHVGEIFGRDHTTVLYARRQITNMLKVYPELRTDIETLKTKIYESGASVKDSDPNRRETKAFLRENKHSW